MTRRTLFSTLIPGAILAPHAFPQSAPDMAEQFRQMSADYERKGLAEPFKGITSNGTVESGLFGIHATGVSTVSVRNAAERFLASLTAAAARPDDVRSGRSGMAQVDEPALLRTPGRQLPGDDGRATQRRLRSAAGIPERARPAS